MDTTWTLRTAHFAYSTGGEGYEVVLEINTPDKMPIALTLFAGNQAACWAYEAEISRQLDTAIAMQKLGRTPQEREAVEHETLSRMCQNLMSLKENPRGYRVSSSSKEDATCNQQH